MRVAQGPACADSSKADFDSLWSDHGAMYIWGAKVLYNSLCWRSGGWMRKCDNWQQVAGKGGKFDIHIYMTSLLCVWAGLTYIGNAGWIVASFWGPISDSPMGQVT